MKSVINLFTKIKSLSNVKIIFLISLLISIIFLFNIPLSFFPDSTTYYTFAKLILHSSDIGTNALSTSYFRTPGYPFLLILGGVTGFNTFWGILFLQFLMALFLPVLIYKILEYYNVRTAFYTALFSMVLLIPYIFMKSLLTEQPYIFGYLLLLYFFVKYLNTNKIIYIYFVSLTCLFQLLLRPSANYIYFIVYIITFVYSKESKKRIFWHLLINFIIILFFQGIWLNIKNSIFSSLDNNRRIYNDTSLMGSMLFFNSYLSHGYSAPARPFVKPSYGPSSREFIAILTNSQYNYKNYINQRLVMLKAELKDSYGFYYGRFEGDLKKLAINIIESPSRTYQQYLLVLFNHMIGPSKADNLFLRVSIEKIMNEPSSFLKFSFRNSFQFIRGLPCCYINNPDPGKRIWVYRPYLIGLMGYSPYIPKNILSENLIAEASLFQNNNIVRKGIGFYQKFFWIPLFTFIRPIIFILMLLSLFLFLKGKYGPLILLADSFIMYHIIITSVFNEPLDRYLYHLILVEIIVAAMVLHYLICKFFILFKREKYV